VTHFDLKKLNGIKTSIKEVDKRALKDLAREGIDIPDILPSTTGFKGLRKTRGIVIVPDKHVIQFAFYNELG
jgi:hypothetical protein